ncbi:MAG TPA: hypothetical protein VFB51_11690 [Solirubrobacterales bacterium]|nr:hypothetical protein [Solirubrobacterales bacterium]
MPTATRKGSDRIAPAASPATLPEAGELLSELGVVYPVMTFTGAEEGAEQADTGEAPSAAAIAQGEEERRSEMDQRILAGLVRA